MIHIYGIHRMREKNVVRYSSHVLRRISLFLVFSEGSFICSGPYL